MIDDREKAFSADPARIAFLCHRQYGIGADGLILLDSSSVADFGMRFFNADGLEAGMCGNGLRCLIGFVRDLGVKKNPLTIETSAGVYRGRFFDEKVEIEMGMPKILEQGGKLFDLGDYQSYFWIECGVPHLVCFVESVEIPDFSEQARALRFHSHFSPSGVNVNFATLDRRGTLRVRTYERGVERETLSCGTGATAVCLAAWHVHRISGTVPVVFSSNETLEFDLLVENEILQEMTMKGPVTHVFTGKLEI